MRGNLTVVHHLWPQWALLQAGKEMIGPNGSFTGPGNSSRQQSDIHCRNGPSMGHLSASSAWDRAEPHKGFLFVPGCSRCDFKPRIMYSEWGEWAVWDTKQWRSRREFLPAAGDRREIIGADALKLPERTGEVIAGLHLLLVSKMLRKIEEEKPLQKQHKVTGLLIDKIGGAVYVNSISTLKKIGVHPFP